jgi:hypothetical protein
MSHNFCQDLDQDIWKSLFWHFENDISTLQDLSLNSLENPNVSIFVKILIKTLDPYIWKSLSPH